MISRLMSVKEVADILGLKVNTIYKMVSKRSIASSKVGRYVRFAEEDVVNFLAGSRSLVR